MRRHDDARIRARYLIVALTVLTAACRTVSEPEPGTDAAYERALAPTLTTDTLQAKNIVLVDEKGHRTLMLSGSAGPGGPIILMSDDEEKALLMITLAKDRSTGEGTVGAVIHAESGDFGMVKIVVVPDGAQILMGSDETEGFELTCGKDGVIVAVEPQDGPELIVGGPGSTFPPKSRSEPESKKRGVRITLEQGKVVVRDLAGRELGVLPDAAPIPPAPK